MSEPTDIKALDEYLKKGSEVSQRYRELGSDDVPPELDRRVLEAARAAVANESPSRSRSWLRWSAPLAVAASVVLVVTVVLEGGLQDKTVAPSPAQAPPMAPQQRGLVNVNTQAADEESKLADKTKLQEGVVADRKLAPVAIHVVPESPQAFVPPPEIALPEPAPAQASVAKVEAEQATTVAAKAAAEQYARRDEAEGAGLVANVPASAAAAQPAEADSSADLQEVSVAGSRSRHVGRTAGPRGTVPTDSLRRETRPASDEPASRSDPQAWLEEIRELRRERKTQDADREWLRFREAFPDFPVADDDVARKKP